jgi:Zn-dependent protease with chaperone function
MIQIDHLSKKFGRAIAVEDVSLAIADGGAVALWGANGAGKTTIIRCVLGLLLMMILAPIAAMLIQAAISRSREFAADAGGAAIAGSPYGLADALRKLERASKQLPLDANPATAHMFIVKPFSGAGVGALFSTHPPTEARIQALLQSR